MRTTTVVLLLVALVLALLLMVVRSAHAEEAMAGYLLPGPNDGWYALATPAGRWKVQLAADCPIQAPSDVQVSTGDEPTAIATLDGSSCLLANVGKVSELPCFTAFGLCEVRLELLGG